MATAEMWPVEMLSIPFSVLRETGDFAAVLTRRELLPDDGSRADSPCMVSYTRLTQNIGTDRCGV
jgi:hypothetical protein